MLVETKLLGEVVIEEKNIFTFEQGLPGFFDLKKFAIVPIEQDSPFVVLQSIEDKEIGFVLALPFAIKPDYAFDLSEDDLEDLQIEKQEDLLTYGIVTLQESIANSTINLLAPIILNTTKMIGKQIVLQDNKAYPLRYPIGALEGSAK